MAEVEAFLGAPLVPEPSEEEIRVNDFLTRRLLGEADPDEQEGPPSYTRCVAEEQDDDVDDDGPPPWATSSLDSGLHHSGAAASSSGQGGGGGHDGCWNGGKGGGWDGGKGGGWDGGKGGGWWDGGKGGGWWDGGKGGGDDRATSGAAASDGGWGKGPCKGGRKGGGTDGGMGGRKGGGAGGGKGGGKGGAGDRNEPAKGGGYGAYGKSAYANHPTTVPYRSGRKGGKTGPPKRSGGRHADWHRQYYHLKEVLSKEELKAWLVKHPHPGRE